MGLCVYKLTDSVKGARLLFGVGKSLASGFHCVIGRLYSFFVGHCVTVLLSKLSPGSGFICLGLLFGWINIYNNCMND